MAQFGNFQNFTWDQLDVAKNSRKALMKKIQQLEKSTVRNIQFDEKILEILSDNLNTPKLFAEIHDALNSGENIYASLADLDRSFLKLGLFETEEVLDIPAEIESLAQQRIQAKADKNYALADELRNQITALGYVIKDVKSDK
jgi:cysteinyl-tRNA synthetase